MKHDDSKDRSGGANYNLIADKVGLVPNIRRRDNLVQLFVGLACAAVGAILALLYPGALSSSRITGILIGAMIGFVIGGLLVGFILMIFGLIRKS